VGKKSLDRLGALQRSTQACVALDVVCRVLVDLVELARGQTRIAVPAMCFTPLKLVEGAPHADEDDVLRTEQRRNAGFEHFPQLMNHQLAD
jgi:hypothetical protein